MASSDNWHVHPGRDCCGASGPRLVWPPLDFAETWFGGEYPAGRGQQAVTAGWQCPGCSRCFAPTVRECSHCGPKALRDRIPAEEPPSLAGSHRTCPAPLEGGMCGCEDGDTP